MMDNLTYYLGQDVKKCVEVSGRRPDTMHFLIAAYLKAMEEKYDMTQVIKMLGDINDFVPEPINKEQTIKELGF
jgi:hypothetical protein